MDASSSPASTTEASSRTIWASPIEAGSTSAGGGGGTCCLSDSSVSPIVPRGVTARRSCT
eukprot:965142-Prymnesium_polylepis.2